MPLNGALAVAGQSLSIFSAGIQVAGSNIANAGTPGYIREQLDLTTAPPFERGGLIFGSGATATGITQQIDKFLETRIHAANTDLFASEAREAIFKQLEVQLRELGAGDLSTRLSEFLAALHDVANQPESVPLRQFAIDQGQRFASDLKSLRTRIDELRTRQTVTVNSLVEEANGLIEKIAQLNPQIVSLESAGLVESDAGALRTQRYEALNRLSEIIPIRYVEFENGGVDLFTGSDYLVLGPVVQTLEAVPSVDRGVQVSAVQTATTKFQISANATGGEIRGIVEGRDNVLGGFADELDKFASNIIREFNRIHASGEGLIGFNSVTSEFAPDDAAATLNSSAAGLTFPPNHGSFQVKVLNKLTGLTETTTINVDLDGIGTDTTLNSLQTAIDAVGDISATITADGRLKIDAANNFEIRFANDTSGALTGLGINTFFTGTTSDTVGVNATIVADHRLLATGQGGGPSDSRNAELLAQFDANGVTALNGVTLREFYELSISSVAQRSSSETAIADGLRNYHESLKNQRDQISGVSIDEETISILEFQHAFQAAARMINVIDELMTTLLSI